jgi:RNA polymerase sigma factor (sigma-70 family)
MTKPALLNAVPAAPAPPSSSDHWGALMAAAQEGNGGAYHRLLSEILPWLNRFFARRLPPAQVDDAVQETLVAIHTKRHTYAPDRPFRNWLAGVARYKWIDRLRIMGRDACEMLDDDIPVDDHEREVTSSVLMGQLLGQLRPAQAQVIRLVKLQGYSIEDAAAATGQSPSLVKVNIHRGLGKLSSLVAGERAA